VHRVNFYVHEMGRVGPLLGPLNEVVHIWAYDDLNHRERARKAQGEDPQLQAFRPKAQAMIVSQYNKILVPANFSPLK
jgi:hypothetical protein